VRTRSPRVVACVACRTRPVRCVAPLLTSRCCRRVAPLLHPVAAPLRGYCALVNRGRPACVHCRRRVKRACHAIRARDFALPSKTLHQPRCLAICTRVDALPVLASLDRARRPRPPLWLRHRQARPPSVSVPTIQSIPVQLLVPVERQDIYLAA
jgi:hypothetical protein